MKISIVAIGLFMAFMLVVKDADAIPSGEDPVCSTLPCSFIQKHENSLDPEL
eukprot:gene13944-15399_t